MIARGAKEDVDAGTAGLGMTHTRINRRIR
jgi:hypothetical protein